MPNMPGDPVLPEQSPHTLQEKIEQMQQRKTLLAEWRATGSVELMTRADALEERYHARDMAELASDVYRSAAHEPASPGLGWIRVSEHPELLKQRLGVEWSERQIHEYLQPDESDFRAEIYLPDPRVYGPDVKPVIADKGSNGLVAVPDAEGGTVLRESTLEDWIENGRQGVGLESNHANRAMTLATNFQYSFGKPFENVGHSKGGADASAAAEVTGMPAYTYNSAGLHPNTLQRYVEQHGGTTYDESSIHSYHVKGEMLHDAQTGIHDMAALTRVQLGLAARQLGELGQLDDVHVLLGERLAQALPYDRKMQADALALVDYLGSHSGARILAGVPLAAGNNPIELPAKRRDSDGQLIDRPAQPSLGDIGADAGPLMNMVSGALAGGVAGKRLGDALAAGGRGVEQGAQRAGAGVQNGMEVFGYVLNVDVQGHGRLVAGVMHYGGAAAADMRVMHGQVRASVERGMGTLAQLSAGMDGAMLRAGSHVPGLQGLRQIADREARAATTYAGHRQTDAIRELYDAHRDARALRQFADEGAAGALHASAIVGQTLEHGAHRGGEWVSDGYRALGSSVRTTTDRAPEAGAAFGAVSAAVGVALGQLATDPLRTARQSNHVVKHGKSAVAEAVDRHGVAGTVLPSLDADNRRMENEGMDLLHTLQRAPSSAQPPVTVEGDPNAFLQRMLDSAKSGDWTAFRNDTQTLANMQPGRELHAHVAVAADQQEQHVLNQQALTQQPATQPVSQPSVAPGMSR